MVGKETFGQMNPNLNSEYSDLVAVILHFFPDNKEVELASLAPYLKSSIPRLYQGKGLCKQFVRDAARDGVIKLDQRGKQNYISLVKPGDIPSGGRSGGSMYNYNKGVGVEVNRNRW